ncbi:MAG: hypothetical protein JST92_18160 [Deltaproteobacteria bacterium]|nr:hypothetical protein [Deltaproteobacteria bacterium]
MSPVAEVDGEPISVERFNQLFTQRTPLAVGVGKLSTEGAYRLKHQLAEELIEGALLDREAKRRGVMTAALASGGLQGQPLDPAAVDVYLRALEASTPGAAIAITRQEAEAALRKTLAASARQDLLASLRAGAHITDHLAERYPGLAAAAAKPLLPFAERKLGPPPAGEPSRLRVAPGDR